MQSAYSAVSSNQLKTWIIMILFSAFVFGMVAIFTTAVGFSSETGLGYFGLAFIVIGIINFFSYYYADRMVLGISGAKPIKKDDAPALFRTVENLSIAAGVPMPKIYLMDEEAPNAFATGRDPKHASIAVTRGLLNRLDRLELEGVVGHELSHIRNYDTRLMSIVAILVGTVALIADWFRFTVFWGGGRDRGRGVHPVMMVAALVLAILAPIIGLLIQLAISRRREFLADASSTLLTRHPEGLASALLKIEKSHAPMHHANAATAHLFIANPLAHERGTFSFSRFFMTHPPVADRVRALHAMIGR